MDSNWLMGWRFTIVALLVVVGSLVWLGLRPGDPVVESIVASLVTTALITILFERLVQPGNQQQTVAAVERVLETLPEVVASQINAAPSRIYPARNDPDPAINRDIMTSMLASDRYLFQGVSGKYVAARLPRPPDTRPAAVKLVLLHPNDGFGVRLRAHEREHDPLYLTRGMTLEQHIEEVRTDIRRSIVALFDHRAFHEVTIGLSMHTALMTLEVFDHVAYVRAWPDGTQRHTYPETYRFDEGSPMYELLKDTLMTQLRQCDADLHMKPDWDDSQLIDRLCDLGFPAYDVTQLEADRKEIKAFHDAYRANLAGLSVLGTQAGGIRR